MAEFSLVTIDIETDAWVLHDDTKSLSCRLSPEGNLLLVASSQGIELS